MEGISLTDPHPTYSSYLHQHPIHSKKRGTVRHGFTYVENYNYLFIRAKDTPAWVWPVNAADWGFIEYLPSQSDMRPQENPRQVVGHPALNQNGDLQLVHKPVLPAFSYWVPEDEPKCSQRRSCRITHWLLDPATSEAILDSCWGCRRMGRRCSMQGKRIPRKYIQGAPIGRIEDKKPFAGFKWPKMPPEWQDIPRFRQAELLIAYNERQEAVRRDGREADGGRGGAVAGDRREQRGGRKSERRGPDTDGRPRSSNYEDDNRRSSGMPEEEASEDDKDEDDGDEDDGNDDYNDRPDGGARGQNTRRNLERVATRRQPQRGQAESRQPRALEHLYDFRNVRRNVKRAVRQRVASSSSSPDLDPLRDRRRDVNGDDEEEVSDQRRVRPKGKLESVDVKSEPGSQRDRPVFPGRGQVLGGANSVVEGSSGTMSNPINAEYDWAGAANTPEDAIEIGDTDEEGNDADNEKAEETSG